MPEKLMHKNKHFIFKYKIERKNRRTPKKQEKEKCP
jgi:hypothetical protein